MARTERDATGDGPARRRTSDGATAAPAGPPLQWQPNAQPASQLNNVLDTFMKDGMAFNNASPQQARPPSNNSPTSGSLQHLSNEELNRLLNFDGSFDLEVPLPDIFSDGDGNELLSLEFPGLNSVQPAHRNNASSSWEVHQQHQRPSSTAGGAAPSEVDAARSVLASLQGPTAGSSGAGAIEDDHGGVGGAPSNAPFYCPSPSQTQQPQMMVSHPQYFQQQHQHSFYPGPLMHGNNLSNGGGGGGGSGGMPLSMPQHGIPVYVDYRTGQILHVSSGPSPPSHSHGHHHQQWQQMSAAAPSYFPPNAGQHPQWSTQYHSGVHQHQPQPQHYPSGIEGLSGSMGPPPPMMALPQQNMHFMDPHSTNHSTMMAHPGLPSSTEKPPSPRKIPKRKRGPKVDKVAATTETMSQRSAKAEQGYTFDPATNKMYRHGPALEATARDNRELPIVKEIFGSFQQNSYFAGVPPQGYGMPTNNNTTQQQQQQQQQQQEQQYSMPLPPPLPPLQGASGTSIYNMKMQLQDFPSLPNLNHQFQPPSCPPSSQTEMLPPPAMQQPRTAAAAAAPSPPPGQYNSTGDLHPGNQGQNQSLSTSSSMPENAATDMVLPAGRQITASTGHGFITSLVTKELQSSTPPAPPAVENKSSLDNGNNGGDGGSIGSPPQLLGVQRDSWSLFFSAFVMPPAQADTLNGGPINIPSLIDSFSAGGLGGDGSGQQQCIYLGKFPTREQAGRAHDIAALKLYGNSANTNFPKETYATTLPVLQLHSEADVIAALQKDSALALQRTSKFKGVRRTGQGKFEARADLAVVSSGIDQNAIDAAAAAAAAAAEANAATAAVAAISSPQGF